MGLRSLIARALLGKNAVTAAMVHRMQGRKATTLTNPHAFSRDGYGRDADIYAIINIITTNAKAVPCQLFRIDRKAVQSGISRDSIRKAVTAKYQLGGKDAAAQYVKAQIRQGVLIPVDEHPVLDLLAAPNPLQDGQEFFESILGYYNIAGETFIHRVGPDDTSKPPSELWPMRPDLTDVIVGNRMQPIAGYKHSPRGTPSKVLIPPELVLHYKRFNPLNAFRGMSPMQTLAFKIDQSHEADVWNLQMFTNGAAPMGAFVSEGELGDEQYEQLKQWINEDVIGSSNALRPLLLEGGLSWERIGLTPMEMMFAEGESMNRQKKAQAYGIDPSLLGDNKSKTYRNFETALKAAYTTVAKPE